jgi:hemolysin activation/secretion protein
MVNIARSLIIMLFAAGIIAMAACSSSAATKPAAETPVQTTNQQQVQQNAAASTQPAAQPEVKSPAQAAGPQVPSSVPVKTTMKAPPVLSNRIDIVYFHTKIRCVTCLCFEKQVTNLINKYFQDAVNSGKLTYRVLNVQDQQNAALARKYGAVGSQLFINNVINDFDNIEDIQDIWSWDCVDHPSDFDIRVKSLIEIYLKGKP